MSVITAAMVKELRERTGVGMMECKKALVEVDGDLEQAIEALRKAGQAKAVKKGDRTTAEGVVAVSLTPSAQQAVLVEINCETDFVARESRFATFAQQIADVALNAASASVEEVLKLALPEGKTVEETRLALISQLGENISVRRVHLVNADNGVVGTYIHGAAESARIASVVAIDQADASLAKDLAMHVAAMKPEFIDAAAVPEDRIAQEKEIFLAQVQQEQSGKPADILEKIIQGKLKKFVKEITLLGQPFVKNSDQTVEQLLKGAKATVQTMVRFEVGEGIEKKQDNFVSEVMSQIN